MIFINDEMYSIRDLLIETIYGTMGLVTILTLCWLLWSDDMKNLFNSNTKDRQ